MPRTLCFDFDGTLCTNTFGDYAAAEPFPWAIERVNELARAGHTIKILTARGSATGIDWSEVTRGQLERWGVAYDELHFGKPSADVYVDDRAIHTDSWRLSDIARAPGFARAVGAEDGEIPEAGAPSATAVVEVLRTGAGRVVDLDRHAERASARARAAGLRPVARAEEVRDAVREAVELAAGEADDDLVVEIAHSQGGRQAAVDVFDVSVAGGLHVSCRRLSQVAAGLVPFLADGDHDAPALRGWPLGEDEEDGIVDRLGSTLAIVRGREVFFSPGPAIADPAVVRTQALARAAGLAVDERPIRPEDLGGAQEAMLVGMPFCVLALAEAWGTTFPAGAPGETARTLLEGWSEDLGVVLGPPGAPLAGRVGAR